MISVEEFLLRARLDRTSLDTWIAAGWLILSQEDKQPAFSDVDLARAQLIRDLRDDIGVNEEGISVILHLLDQMHGLRRSMHEVLQAMRAGEQPSRPTSRTPRRPRPRR
jgi:chaperone modulatory protein CbpM